MLFPLLYYDRLFIVIILCSKDLLTSFSVWKFYFLTLHRIKLKQLITMLSTQSTQH